MIYELLYDMYELGHAQGLHTGRWEDEYSQEETTKIFFADIIEFAKKYDIKTYSKIEYLKSDKYRYLIEDEDYHEYQVLDEVATDLVDEIKDKIYKKIKELCSN